jgi:hypothetical protein
MGGTTGEFKFCGGSISRAMRNVKISKALEIVSI